MPRANGSSVHWVKPELLCEVAFTEWTQDGRIRHPSFQGLREDKDAGDVKKETASDNTPKPRQPATAENKAGTLVVSGITITHPDRVISETGHVTKGELAEYYAGVARLHAAAHRHAGPSACCAAPPGSTASVSFSAIPAGVSARMSIPSSSGTKARNTNISISRMKKACWK